MIVNFLSGELNRGLNEIPSLQALAGDSVCPCSFYSAATVSNVISYRLKGRPPRPALVETRSGLTGGFCMGMDIGTRGWASAILASGASHTLASICLQAFADGDEPISFKSPISDVVRS